MMPCLAHAAYAYGFFEVQQKIQHLACAATSAIQVVNRVHGAHASVDTARQQVAQDNEQQQEQCVNQLASFATNSCCKQGAGAGLLVVSDDGCCRGQHMHGALQQWRAGQPTRMLSSSRACSM
jgi:predicted phosphoribosyltransferase